MENQSAAEITKKLFEFNDVQVPPSDPVEDLKTPRKYFRNNDGLIEGINYIFNSDNTVNWRKMLLPEHLVPNQKNTKEVDVSKLEDKDLLILLAGIRHLARLRGFSAITFRVVQATVDYAAVICQINWTPNYETSDISVFFEAVADAHHFNTKDFATHYLTSIAENRAFCRCVRQFLGISVVSQEEAGEATQDKAINATDMYAVLQQLMDDKQISFDFIKEKLKKKIEGAADFKTVKDIPENKVFNLIEKLKKYKPKLRTKRNSKSRNVSSSHTGPVEGNNSVTISTSVETPNPSSGEPGNN